MLFPAVLNDDLNNMYHNILDKKRKKILLLFKEFKRDFYLAGGTALALQLGHRHSIDFDFFTNKEFNPDELWKKIKLAVKSRKLEQVQNERNTLSVIIDDVKFSFIYSPYPLLAKPISEENIRLASIQDIGCMKLSAIISRATNKDYIDIYYILQEISLKKLLKYTNKKMPELDENLILKSVVYFKDIKIEKIEFITDKKINFKTVENFLQDVVEDYVQLPK